MASDIHGHLECFTVVWGLFPHPRCYNGIRSNDHPFTLRSSMDSWFSDVVRRHAVRLRDFQLLLSKHFCRHSDASGDRFWHVTGPLLMGIVGFVTAILTMNTAVRYLSLWVEQPLLLSCVTHVVQIFHGSIYSRIRCIIGVDEQLDTRIIIQESCCHSFRHGSCGLWKHRSIVSLGVSANNGTSYMYYRYLWPASWGPSYSKSYMICILGFVITILMLWVYRLHLTWLNGEADKNEHALALPRGFRYIT